MRAPSNPASKRLSVSSPRRLYIAPGSVSPRHSLQRTPALGMDTFSVNIIPDATFEPPVLRRTSAVSWTDEGFADARASLALSESAIEQLRRQFNLPAAKKVRTKVDITSKTDEPYGSVKMGEQRRKMIKSAISEIVLNNDLKRQQVKEIASIKTATVSELMEMCEICGILEWALNLVGSRKTEKHLPKLVD